MLIGKFQDSRHRWVGSIDVGGSSKTQKLPELKIGSSDSHELYEFKDQ